MCPATIEVRGDNFNAIMQTTADGVLNKVRTPVGDVCAYVCRRRRIFSGSLYERFGVLLPDSPRSPYDNKAFGITGHGLWFGGDESLFSVFERDHRKKIEATKIICSRTYDSQQGRITIQITATEGVPKGKKVKQIVIRKFRPQFVPA